MGRLGTVFTRVFGKNAADFVSKRLGPAMALVGIGLSGLWLAQAIATHDVRNIVFEAVNAFFSLAEAAAIGADLIVAGAYGHSRAREWLLGGATRDLLGNPQRYLLLSH